MLNYESCVHGILRNKCVFDLFRIKKKKYKLKFFKEESTATFYPPKKQCVSVMLNNPQKYAVSSFYTEYFSGLKLPRCKVLTRWSVDYHSDFLGRETPPSDSLM